MEHELNKEREVYELRIKSYERNRLLEKEQKEAEYERIMTEKDFNDMQLKFEADQVKQEMEFENRKKRILDMEKEAKYQQKMKLLLRKEAARFTCMIEEAILMAKTLRRNVHFSLQITHDMDIDGDESIDNLANNKIKIKIENFEDGRIMFWSIDKFNDRFYIIRDQVEHFFETNQILVQTQQEDPFWDPPEQIEIGSGLLMMKPLAYLFDIEKKINVYGPEKEIGSINVEVFPCNTSGAKIDEDDMEDEFLDPLQLVNQRVDFMLMVHDGTLDADSSRDAFVEYKLNLNNQKKTFRTEICKGKNNHPVWNYSKQHSYDKITEVDIGKLIDQKVIFSKNKKLA